MEFKDIVILILSAISAFFAWFMKKIYAEHSLVFEHYTKNKDSDIHKMLIDIETIKGDIKRVESESKRYWNEQNKQIESNQTILLERINHSNDNTKAGYKGIIDLMERLEARFDKLEDRINK